MFLLRGNVHDIAWDDDLLLRFDGNDALARGHEQHLIAAATHDSAFSHIALTAKGSTTTQVEK